MINPKEIIAVTPFPVGVKMVACSDIKSDRDKLGNQVFPFHTVRFGEVFTKVYDHDAFFVSYVVKNSWEEDEQSFVFPRLTNESARQLEEKGEDVLTTCLVLDLDFPKKSAWTRDKREELDKVFNIVRPPTVVYPSKHGCRVIYRLVEPIHISQTRSCLELLGSEYFKAGCTWVDDACYNWGRLFRLMYVQRGKDSELAEGQPSWEEPYLDIAPFELNLDVEIDFKDLNVQEVSRTTISVPDNLPAFAPVEMPNPLHTKKDGRSLATYYKTARKALQGRECYRALFEEAEENLFAEEGERDTTLQAYTGQVVSLLFHNNDHTFTEQEVFSLFYEPVSGLESDAETPDWHARCWYLIQEFWHKEECKVAEVEHDETTAQEHFLNGVREWSGEDTIELFMGSTDEAIRFMEGKYIAFNGKSYFVMTPDGRFCPVSICKEQLPAVVRSLGMHRNLMPLTKATARGISPVTPQDLLDKHGMPVSQVIGKVAEGNYVENLDDHDNRILVLKLFERKANLEPEWNDDVDDWLHMLGGERYKPLCEWVGHSLAFETNPIRALSIIGPPSIGKKVFVQGLAECVNTNRFSTSSDLGKFRGNLLKSPFLNINEGFPQSFQSFEAPGTAIKNLMSGDSMRVEDKYQTPIWILNPLRIIFTANSYEILEDLVKNRDCPPSERISLEQRILNIHPDHRCADWLRGKGGLSFTRGWIRGDGGQQSQYTVARHFLELHRRLHGDGQVPPVKRFYMEGFPCPEIEKIFRRTSSRTSEIIEIVLFLITRPDRENGIETSGAGEIFVTPKRVLDASRTSSIVRRPLTNKDVVEGLKNICVDGKKAETDQPGANRVKFGWIELDPSLLLDFAVDYGDLEAHKRLEEIIDNRKAAAVDKYRGLSE